MGCLVVLFGLALPRVLMIFIWLFSNGFGRAFNSVFWPFLGFIFMPYTTLAYMLAMLQNGALNGIWLIFFIIAIFIDLGQGGHASHRTRYMYVQRG